MKATGNLVEKFDQLAFLWVKANNNSIYALRGQVLVQFSALLSERDILMLIRTTKTQISSFVISKSRIIYIVTSLSKCLSGCCSRSELNIRGIVNVFLIR